MFLVGGRVIGDALQLLLYIVIVRRFSEQEIGDYSFAFATAMLLGSIVAMGARSLITREVANTPMLGAAYPLNMAALHCALSFIAGGGLVFWAHLAGFSGTLTALCLLAFAAAGTNSIAYSAVAVVDAAGQVERGAQSEVLGRGFGVMLGFAALLAGLSLPVILGAQVAGALCYLGLAMYWAHKTHGPLAWRLDISLIRRTAKAAIPFALAALLYALYARIDIVMLHRMAGPVDTSYYAVSFRIIEATFIIASMVGIAMFPELAAGGRSGGADRKQLFGQASRWLGVLGAVISIALVIAGDQLATLVFGQDFEVAGDLLRVMALLVVIGYIKEPFWRLLVAQGRERLQLYIQGGAVTLNIGLNVLLIPQYGGFGAVAASVISETVMLAGFAIAIVRQGWIDLLGIGGWFASVGLACAVGFALRQVMAPLAAGALSVIALCCFFYLMRVVRLSELPWMGARFDGTQTSSRPTKGVNNKL